ncbi:MAG: ABC transporter substrate-binding protein [Hyphomicrobiaceae bacterium]
MVLAGVGGLTAFIASPEHANAGGDRPVIAFFRSSPAGPFAHIVEAFRAGVAEEGLVEGESVDIAYHWGDNKLDRLPAMAEAIVESGAAVIVGNSLAIEAVRAHSDRVPMVFVLAEDPIAAGMVDNLASPSGNITGVTFYGGGQLAAKRAELLMEIAPSAKRIALLLDPNYAGSDPAREGAETLLRPLGIEIVAAEAAKPEALEATFAGIVAAKADALLVGGSPMQTSQRKKIIAFAAAHRLPAVYDQKDYVTDGGLISYGASFATAYRQAGVYAARIVRGAKTAELPVLRPSTYELVVNVVTGKALGIEIPNAVLLRADEVIE